MQAKSDKLNPISGPAVYKDVMTWGSVGRLLDAVQPKCGCCDLPATRRAKTLPRQEDNPFVLDTPFCDEHDFSQWTGEMLHEYAEKRGLTDPRVLREATYEDLPHAMPVRQLMGQVKDDSKRYVLRLIAPQEQRMGDFLVLVHDSFIVIRVPPTATQADIERAMFMTEKATGVAEILVVHDNIDIQVFAVVVPPSRYEQMRDGFGEDLDGEGD